MEAFKDQFFNQSYIITLAEDIKASYPEFDSLSFIDKILDSDWNTRELKDRMHWISYSLHSFLPSRFEEALNILSQVATYRLSQNRWGGGDLVFPDFVEQYGIQHYSLSMDALELFTQLSTAEFAVRPFIANYPEKMMHQMLIWASHPNEHVRRLASEGCRPKLPWGMVLRNLVNNPSPIIPVLEKLFNDSSEYVRKSVSNNLNDISKDHPELVIAFCKKMRNSKPKTERLIKHGLRTLLKNGNHEALNLFEFDTNLKLKDTNFTLGNKSLLIGEKLQMKLEFSISNAQKIRVEYRIFFARPSGKSTSKLFQWTEKNLTNIEKIVLIKNHSFADVSIRKHYEGEHRIQVFVNGKLFEEKSVFLLK